MLHFNISPALGETTNQYFNLARRFCFAICSQISGHDIGPTRWPRCCPYRRLRSRPMSNWTISAQLCLIWSLTKTQDGNAAGYTARTYSPELLRKTKHVLLEFGKSVWVEMAGLGPQQAKSSGLQLVPGTRRHALQSEFRVPGLSR